MSQFDTLIYDRTQADVEHRNALHGRIAGNTASASDIAEWLQDNQKGSFNYTDMNRIGTLLVIIKALSDEIGMALTYPHSVVTNFNRLSLPTQTDVAHMLGNITAVKTTYAHWIATEVPTNVKTIEAANAIEWILAQVEPIIDGTKNEYKYSAEVYAGGY